MVTSQDVTQAIGRYKAARPALRSATHASALAVATSLADSRDDLMEKMEIRWRWLDGHPDHSAFVEREDALIADMRVYEAQEDALAMALLVLFEDVA